MSRVLVVTEVALACAVLMASALLVRSVNRMMSAPTGVIADGVLTATLQLEVSGLQVMTPPSKLARRFPFWSLWTSEVGNPRRPTGPPLRVCGFEKG